MIVKINNRYYHSDKDPIMVALTEEERLHLKKVIDTQSFFVACPNDMKNFEVEEFIEDQVTEEEC